MRRYSTASELRAKAKGALKGRWLTAVVAFLLVGVFGMMGGSVSFNFSSLMYDDDATVYEETTDYEDTEFVEDVENVEIVEGEVVEFTDEDVIAVAVVFGVIALIVLLYSIFVAGPVRTGYYRFNLDLYSRFKGGKLEAMWFGFKSRYWKSVGTYLLQGWVIFWKAFVWYAFAGLFLGLGTAMGANSVGAILILVGVILFFWAIVRIVMLAFDYAMVGHLIADRADLSPRQILAASKKMMYGNRLRLLGLELSFIGWFFVVILTLGLGSPFLGAYMQAAQTAFYRELPKPRV